MLLVFFYTPWKYQKTSDFLTFSGGIERDQWHEMGWRKQVNESVHEKLQGAPPTLFWSEEKLIRRKHIFYWDVLLTFFNKIWARFSEVYLEPSRASMMEGFAKIINRFEPLTIFAKTLKNIFAKCSTGF